MLSILMSQNRGPTQIAQALIDGHHQFFKNNTGITYNPKTDLYVMNPEGVVSNNRHFISDTRAEYQPNGDATSEAQTITILGYCYAYLATKREEYKEAAIHAWEAYVNYFYAGQPVPETPQRWICNWLVNGKEPTLANWPVNPEVPTGGGYKSVPLRFTNGRCQVPHGSPFWGEYMDVVTFAHRGHMAWRSIDASVRRISNNFSWDAVYQHRVKTMPAEPWSHTAWVDWDALLGVNEYSPDWGSSEIVHPATWVNVWTGNRIGVGDSPSGEDWNGDIIQTGIPQSQVGTVQLLDTNINGIYLLNYAVRLPVEHGGYQFARNEVWHNRPVHAPLLGSEKQMGNAADAEEWFADACYLLHVITGEDRYRKAMAACLATNYEYADIDLYDQFFRKSKTAETPYTDGISYGWYYPSDEISVKYTRDGEGIINATVTGGGGQVSFEQQSIWFKVNEESLISTEFGGIGVNRAPVSCTVEMILHQDKQTTDETRWSITLPQSLSSTTRTRNIRISDLTLTASPLNEEAIQASGSSISYWGDLTISTEYLTGVLGNNSGQSVTALFANDSGGLDIRLNPHADIFSVVYKSNGNLNFRFIDDDGWRWWWMIPNTNNQWSHRPLNRSDLSLSYYQPGKEGQVRPSTPNYSKISEITVILDSNDTNVSWTYFSLNGLRGSSESYITADIRATAEWGPVEVRQVFMGGIVDGRSANTVQATIMDSTGGFMVGAWMEDSGVFDMQTIAYMSRGAVDMRIDDDNGWRWVWKLPSTNGRWVSYATTKGKLVFAPKQPNLEKPEDWNDEWNGPWEAPTPPSTPQFTTIDAFVITPDDNESGEVTWAYYCINTLPQRFSGEYAYTLNYRVTLSCTEPFTGKLGDCTVYGRLPSPLAYTPGIIPFSNIYEEGTDQISSWRGLPYPGYQYPLIYVLDSTTDNTYYPHLLNMVDFLYDAQQFYHQEIGELGPVASAYIWNREDSMAYGPPDTFTMYHWGDGRAWSGYQPRAFQGACRAWHELVIRERQVPPKLITFCENYLRWLIWYADTFDGQTPTDFPPDAPARPLPWDFTGHMNGLWLCGAAMAAMAGSTVPGIERFMEACIRELEDNYVITGVPGHPMDGSWSPAVRLETGNGMYFGFWGGEIMRGLGAYLLYKKYGSKKNIYQYR